MLAARLGRFVSVTSSHRLRSALHRVVAAIEGRRGLDRPSYRAEHVAAFGLNMFGGATGKVRNALHGTWLGHPLHPLLTDLPVGAWTAALVLDGVDAVSPQPEGFRSAARLTVGVGLAGGIAAAGTGLADWQHTHDNARRVGVVHGLLNTAALGLYGWSWYARRRSNSQGPARAAGAAGYCAVLASGYLGATLVFRHRIGVDHADEGLEPRDYAPALPVAELPEGCPTPVDVEGVGIVLVRLDGRIHAVGRACPHLGGPIAEGWLLEGALVCPWHGSRFDLRTGAPRRGPATTPLPCFETRIREGLVEVRRRVQVPGSPPGSVVAQQQVMADAGG